MITRHIKLFFLPILLLCSVIAVGQNDAYKQARTLAFAGNYEAALEKCDSALSANGDNYDIEMLRTRVLAWDGQYQLSDSICEQLNSKYPKSTEVPLLWATVNRWNQQSDRSVEILNDALLRFPENPEILYNLGRDYAIIGNLEKGFEIEDSLKSIQDWEDDAFLLRLELLILDAQYDSSLFLCDSSLSAQPDHINFRLLRAQTKSKMERYSETREDLDTLFTYDSTNLGGHHLYVNTYLWEAQNDSAIYSAEKGLSMHPNNVTLKVMLGKALLRTDSLHACDSVVSTIIDEDSLHYEAWSIALNSQLAQEDYDSVITGVDSLWQVYTGDQELRRLKVLAQAGLKKYKEAIKTMGDLDAVDSLDVNSKILYAKLHYWDNKDKKSIELVDHFTNDHPNEAALYTVKARAQKSRYEKKKALQTIDLALTLDTNNAELLVLREEVEAIILNEFGGWLTYDFYSNSIDPSQDRKAINLEYLRRIQKHVVIGRLTVANRFDSTGIQGEIDAYPVLTNWLYLYCNIGVSNNWLFPEFRASLEPFFTLPYSLEASIGIRYMQYPTNDVTIYTGSIGAYPGQFWIAARPYITFTNNGVNQSYNLRIRRFFTQPKTYVELSGGFGSSPDNAYLDQAFDQLVDSQSWNVGLTYQQQLGRKFYGKAFLIFDQYYPEQIPDFNIISANLGLWWMF